MVKEIAGVTRRTVLGLLGQAALGLLAACGTAARAIDGALSSDAGQGGPPEDLAGAPPDLSPPHDAHVPWDLHPHDAAHHHDAAGDAYVGMSSGAPSLPRRWPWSKQRSLLRSGNVMAFFERLTDLRRRG